MNKEYVIIDKTLLEKRIEDLEFQRKREPDNHTQSYLDGKIEQLNEVLSQSTSLIPQIEKAFNAGIDSIVIKVTNKENLTVGYSKGFTTKKVGELVELYPRIRNKYDYISKLDI